MSDSSSHPLTPVLSRIADALERATPAHAPRSVSLAQIAHAAVYHAQEDGFIRVEHVPAVQLDLLHGIALQKELLLENIERFARGFPANHAMLWGARGTGKSSLIKAIHQHLVHHHQLALTIIEIAKEDLHALPQLLVHLRAVPSRRFLIFCDDVSFEHEDISYKSLKTVLDGGIEGQPSHVLLTITSNRRHLMPREMSENETRVALHANETIDEKLSLSDRFGLWIGFHPMPQDVYLRIMEGYRDYFQIPMDNTTLHAEAIAWAAMRGTRSGRVAWQCITDIAGRLKVTLSSDT
jgi:predicted AAA+ superfamily ATPase